MGRKKSGEQSEDGGGGSMLRALAPSPVLQ